MICCMNKTCACGCGTAVKGTWAQGHNPKTDGIPKSDVPSSKVCEWCGREYHRSELRSRQSNKHWLGRRFCSSQCQGQFSGWSAQQMGGERHPRWKGDEATKQAGRKRCREMYPLEPCEVCGDPKAERHHVDGNPLNNVRENVRFLCRTHHIRVEDRLSYRRLSPEQEAERKARRRSLANARAARYRERKRQEAGG